MTDYYAQFHPKPRTGKECTKIKCDRHKDYLVWSLGNGILEFCMNCKHAHISQYKNSKLTK